MESRGAFVEREREGKEWPAERGDCVPSSNEARGGDERWAERRERECEEEERCNGLATPPPREADEEQATATAGEIKFSSVSVVAAAGDPQ